MGSNSEIYSFKVVSGVGSVIYLALKVSAAASRKRIDQNNLIAIRGNEYMCAIEQGDDGLHYLVVTTQRKTASSLVLVYGRRHCFKYYCGLLMRV